MQAIEDFSGGGLLSRARKRCDKIPVIRRRSSSEMARRYGQWVDTWPSNTDRSHNNSHSGARLSWSMEETYIAQYTYTSRATRVQVIEERFAPDIMIVTELP